MTGTLKARVAGAWVPILGSGQEAANTARYNSAWGIIATGTVLANSGSDFNLTASATNLVTSAITFTPVTGRRYKVRFVSGTWTSSANASIFAYVWRDGASSGIGDRYEQWITGGAAQQVEGEWLFTGDGVQHSYDVRVVPSAGTHKLLSTATNGMFYIEDMGPVTPVSIAPPTAGPRVVASGNALGIVAIGSFPAGTMSFPPATPGDITNPLYVTTAVGRRYRVNFFCRAIAGASRLTVGLFDGGTAMPGDIWYINGGDYGNLYTYWIIDGDGAAHSYKVRNGVNNPATITLYGDAGSSFFIEDVGPSTFPALPIPATPPAWTPVALQNSWVNTAGQQPASYRKIGDVVTLRGRVNGGSINAVAFTLPVGFGPPVAALFTAPSIVSGYWAFGVIEVGPAGDVSIYQPATNSGVALNNISFSTTP